MRPYLGEDRAVERPQQSNQETVSLVAAADHRSRGRARTQRHDAVDRRDEVRIEDAVAEAERAIDVLELRRHRGGREVVLVEDFERSDQCSMRGLTAARNSVRSCGSLS